MTIKRNKARLLIEFHENKCESCGNEFNTSELQIHNILRNHKYEDHRILKVLCSVCHKKFHENEYTFIKSK